MGALMLPDGGPLERLTQAAEEIASRYPRGSRIERVRNYGADNYVTAYVEYLAGQRGRPALEGSRLSHRGLPWKLAPELAKELRALALKHMHEEARRLQRVASQYLGTV